MSAPVHVNPDPKAPIRELTVEEINKIPGLPLPASAKSFLPAGPAQESHAEEVTRDDANSNPAQSGTCAGRPPRR